MPRDHRPYICVSIDMPDHPKIVALTDAAFRLLIRVWCYCREYKTDGHIGPDVWKHMGHPKTRQSLTQGGCITPCIGRECPDGCVVAWDFLEHQQSAAEIAAVSEKRRDAGRRGGLAKQANRLALAKQTLLQTPSTSRDRDRDRATTTTPFVTSPDVTREPTSRDKRGQRLPEQWTPSTDLVASMRSEGIPDNVARHELPIFRDYWLGQPGQKGVKADWDATWRNWLRRAHEQHHPINGHRAGTSTTDQRVADGLALAAVLRAEEELTRKELTT